MDPFFAAFAAVVFGAGVGFLACIIVELAVGRGSRLARSAIGFGFGVLDLVLFAAVLGVLINVTTDATPFLFAIVGGWVVPALRWWWLLRKPAAQT